MYSTKSSPIQVKFGGVFDYTLTNSAVASDEVQMDFAKRATLYAFYAAGATETGNTVSLTVEVNPYDAASDSTGAYWAQYGIYTDSTGTWSQEAATFTFTQGTAGSYKAQVPITFSNIDGLRIRVKVAESGVATNAGKLRLILVKNEIT